MVVAGDGAPDTNQNNHDGHFGSFNSVGRPRLPLSYREVCMSCRNRDFGFFQIFLGRRQSEWFRALNRSEVLAGANFIALLRGSLHVVCSRVITSAVALFVTFQHYSLGPPRRWNEIQRANFY